MGDEIETRKNEAGAMGKAMKTNSGYGRLVQESLVLGQIYEPIRSATAG